MKVSVELSNEYNPPYAVIYTDAVTQEIQRIIDLLGMKESPLVAQQEDRWVIIPPHEVSMIRVEGGETIIYTTKGNYFSRKRLYELLNQLGNGFMQISKQTIVNLSYIQSVETGFNGTLLLKLKTGDADYVSRKYLPDYKKYLGL